VSPGDAKDRHHSIADEFLDCAAVSLNRAAHLLEVAENQAADRLGIDVLAQRRRPAQVTEEERDEAASLKTVFVRQTCSAPVAETGLRPILHPAPRADRHEPSLGRSNR
jgi:hypothetical protein